MGAIVMDGAVIGDDSVVGGRALVVEGMIVPPKSVILGSPGRVRAQCQKPNSRGLRSRRELREVRKPVLGQLIKNQTRFPNLAVCV